MALMLIDPLGEQLIVLLPIPYWLKFTVLI